LNGVSEKEMSNGNTNEVKDFHFCPLLNGCWVGSASSDFESFKNLILDQTKFHFGTIEFVRNPLEAFLVASKEIWCCEHFRLLWKNVYMVCKQIKKKIKNVNKIVFFEQLRRCWNGVRNSAQKVFFDVTKSFLF
jgi:hypothetical protein